jgi:hypothetical protein
MVFPQALDVGANCILCHAAGFFQRITLSDQSRQRGTSHDKSPSSAGSNNTV